MKRVCFHIGLLGSGIFLFGCSKSDPAPPHTSPYILPSGYEVYLTGGDTVHHDLGPFQLWHKPPDGKRHLVWPYVGDEERVFGEMIVFNSGPKGDRRFPALFAHTPSGKLIEITECVTHYYCQTNNLAYASMRDNLRYIVRAGTDPASVALLAMNTPWAPANVQPAFVSVPVSEIKRWYLDGSTNGSRMAYEKFEYYAASPSIPGGGQK